MAICPTSTSARERGTQLRPGVDSGAVEAACAAHPAFSQITDGRFKGGWTTRHYGRPADGVHAIQMELACRGYMADPAGPVTEGVWPTAYDPHFAAPMRAALADILKACLVFAQTAEPV